MKVRSMHDALSDKDQAFLDAVKSKLAELDAQDDPSIITQDQLDVFLLGGTVPPIPIPQPDPACDDCWGYGKVCPCHGVCAAHGSDNSPDSWRTAHLSRWNTERCRCVR